MGMEVRGYEETVRGLQKLKDGLGEAAQEGVDKSTDILYDASQVQVPKKTGTLSESAEFKDHSTTGPKRSRGLKYGERALNSQGESYAAAVHEILKASHAPPTKAKFVEGPLFENLKFYPRLTASACKKAVKRAFK